MKNYKLVRLHIIGYVNKISGTIIGYLIGWIAQT